MNVRQTYFDFLARQGAKQKIQAIIMDGIAYWRQQQAYYYDSNTNEDPDDNSGYCFPDGDKTIGDIAHSDIEILNAYTGKREASHDSGRGWNWLDVSDHIQQDINYCLGGLRNQFIKENADALFEQYGIKCKPSWDECVIHEELSEALSEYDYGLNEDWMMQEFPEYVVDDEYRGSDYLFWIEG